MILQYYLSSGGFEDALLLLNKVYQKDPLCERAIYYTGITLLQLGRKDEAIIELETLVREPGGKYYEMAKESLSRMHDNNEIKDDKSKIS